MIVDVEEIASLIAEIAQEQIMTRYGKLRAEEIREKTGPHDLVTEVDEATERALEMALRDAYPGAGFVGEELVTKDPDAVNVLTEEGAYWVVDPLDGTRNFVNSVDEFGVIVALVEDGETRAGWIYAVPDAASAIAETGEGATWRGERVRAPGRDRERLIGLRSLGSLPRERQERIRNNIKEHFESRPNRCAAYAYLSLMLGRVDFKISSLIHPWDHAAGALIVSESGGRAAFLDDGEPYRPAPSLRKPLLVCSSAEEWPGVAGTLLS